MDEFKDRPYWTGDHPYGYSADDLPGLEREVQIDVMRIWFFQNFEDPAEKTPYESAEGGYQWIWGGPYDASEELFSEFGDHISEEVIEEIVAEVESDGLYDWAPKNIGDDDVVDADEGPWPPLVVVEPPGSPDVEAVARQEVLTRLTELETAVERLNDQSPMIGHNRPPEPIDVDPVTVNDERTIRLVVNVVREEADQPHPDIGRLNGEASKLQQIASRLGVWLKRRPSNWIAALEAYGAVEVATNLKAIYEALVNAWQSIVNWIELLPPL